jgi:hypothetical protein
MEQGIGFSACPAHPKTEMELISEVMIYVCETVMVGVAQKCA